MGCVTSVRTFGGGRNSKHSDGRDSTGFVRKRGRYGTVEHARIVFTRRLRGSVRVAA